MATVVANLVASATKEGRDFHIDIADYNDNLEELRDLYYAKTSNSDFTTHLLEIHRKYCGECFQSDVQSQQSCNNNDNNSVVSTASEEVTADLERPLPIKIEYTNSPTIQPQDVDEHEHQIINFADHNQELGTGNSSTFSLYCHNESKINEDGLDEKTCTDAITKQNNLPGYTSDDPDKNDKTNQQANNQLPNSTEYTFVSLTQAFESITKKEEKDEIADKDENNTQLTNHSKYDKYKLTELTNVSCLNFLPNTNVQENNILSTPPTNDGKQDYIEYQQVHCQEDGGSDEDVPDITDSVSCELSDIERHKINQPVNEDFIMNSEVTESKSKQTNDEHSGRYVSSSEKEKSVSNSPERKDGKKKFVCKECGKRFKRMAILTRHAKIHTKEKRSYPCQECSKVFFSPERLKVHMRIHTREQLFSCEVCSKCFTSKGKLNKHMKIHTSEKKSHICKNCGKSYSSTDALNAHLRRHHSEKSLCKFCGKDFLKKEHLAKHMAIHRNDRKFACKECGKEFNLKGNMKKHMYIHIVSEKTHICKECGKGFCNDYKLKSHMKCHTVARSFKCKVCDKGFPNLSSLTKHFTVHTNVRQFVCKECGTEFKDKGSLTRHKWLHTDERPYTCRECGKGFYKTYNLEQHMMSHTNKFPFICEVCGKGFRQNGHFERHLIFHRNEKPFMCEECGRRFNDSGNLKKHIVRMHAKE
ncbi:uncharacterized protein LOC144434442 [Glandiceps talaboti]